MTAVELTTRGPAALVDKGYGSGARSTETSAMPVPTGTSLCHRSGFTGNGSRDAHCFIGERLILFLAKMNFAWKSQILRFIYQKLEMVSVALLPILSGSTLTGLRGI